MGMRIPTPSHGTHRRNSFRLTASLSFRFPAWEARKCHEFRRWNLGNRKKRIGYVSDSSLLFSWAIVQQLAEPSRRLSATNFSLDVSSWEPQEASGMPALNSMSYLEIRNLCFIFLAAVVYITLMPLRCNFLGQHFSLFDAVLSGKQNNPAEPFVPRIEWSKVIFC